MVVHMGNEQATPFCAVGGRKLGGSLGLAEPGNKAVTKERKLTNQTSRKPAIYSRRTMAITMRAFINTNESITTKP